MGVLGQLSRASLQRRFHTVHFLGCHEEGHEGGQALERRFCQLCCRGRALDQGLATAGCGGLGRRMTRCLEPAQGSFFKAFLGRFVFTFLPFVSSAAISLGSGLVAELDRKGGR